MAIMIKSWLMVIPLQKNGNAKVSTMVPSSAVKVRVTSGGAVPASFLVSKV